jgi:hypothetical protein
MTNSTVFCVIIDKRIAGPKCPLPNGSCMWAHRQTSNCTYNEQFANSDLTVNEYAAHVGLPPADPEAVKIIKNSLADRIRRELVD